MYSKALKQITRLQLDSAAMRGRVNRNEIAAAIYAIARDSDEFWSLRDKRDALEAYIRAGVTELMDETMSEDYVRTNLPHVPREHLHLLEKSPRFLCVNAGAGLHVLAVNATPDDWAANARMKRKIGQSVKEKADTSEDIYRMLVAEGVQSLAELGTRRAA